MPRDDHLVNIELEKRLTRNNKTISKTRSKSDPKSKLRVRSVWGYSKLFCAAENQNIDFCDACGWVKAKGEQQLETV